MTSEAGRGDDAGSVIPLLGGQDGHADADGAGLVGATDALLVAVGAAVRDVVGAALAVAAIDGADAGAAAAIGAASSVAEARAAVDAAIAKCRRSFMETSYGLKDQMTRWSGTGSPGRGGRALLRWE